jgi:hypothetical protein
MARYLSKHLTHTNLSPIMPCHPIPNQMPIFIPTSNPNTHLKVPDLSMVIILISPIHLIIRWADLVQRPCTMATTPISLMDTCHDNQSWASLNNINPVLRLMDTMR